MKKLISMALAAGMAVSLAAFKLSRIRFREVWFMLVFMLVRRLPRQPIPPLLPPPRPLPTAIWPTSRVRAR